MSKNVFISYRHSDAGWVRDTLYPVLSAGGARVTVDYKDFDAGLALRQQISARQAAADVHLLVFTPDYFTSDYCLDEMRRAAATDPRGVWPFYLTPALFRWERGPVWPCIG